MLQRDNENLRMRVKAMQETIDHLNAKVTQLLSNEINLLLTKTGQRFNCENHFINVYHRGFQMNPFLLEHN